MNKFDFSENLIKPVSKVKKDLNPKYIECCHRFRNCDLLCKKTTYFRMDTDIYQ